MSTASTTHPPRRVFDSLHVRNFRLFFLGQGISQIGNWITLLAQGLLVYELTESGVALGTLVACQFLPVLLIGAWTGLVADRSDKRKLLVTTQIIAMMQSFVLAALALADRPLLLAIYGVALAGGTVTAFDAPARRAFVVEMVPSHHVQNAVSLNAAMMTGSRIVGPALAGMLVATVGYSWCFVIDGLSYLAVIYGLVAMDAGELHRPDVSPRAKGQVREGIRYSRSVPDIWTPLVMLAVVGTISFNFNVVFQLLVQRTFGGTEVDFTWLLSFLSVGSLAAALVVARRPDASLRQVSLGAFMFGVAMLVMSASPNLWCGYLVACAVGFGSSIFISSGSAIVQLRSAPEMRGRVVALQSIVFLGSTPIGGPVLGVICEYLGARVGVVVGGVAALGTGVWGYAVERRRRLTPCPLLR